MDIVLELSSTAIDHYQLTKQYTLDSVLDNNTLEELKPVVEPTNRFPLAVDK